MAGDVLRTQELSALAAKSPTRPLLTRQALHSSVLTFAHPAEEKRRVSVLAPAPADVASALAHLRQFRLRRVVPPEESGAVVDLARILVAADETPLPSAVKSRQRRMSRNAKIDMSGGHRGYHRRMPGVAHY